MTTPRKSNAPPAKPEDDADSVANVRFPTIKELVAIAASIASPDEDEKVTVRRSLKLWQACDEVLKEQKEFTAQKRVHAARIERILSTCGLTKEDLVPDIGNHVKTVPLEVFLKAVDGGDPRTLGAKWPDFWKRETQEVIPKLRGGMLPYSSRPYLLPDDPTGPISAVSVIRCAERFSEFVKRAVGDSRSANAATGPMWAKRYEAAKKLLHAKGEPSKEAAAILKALSAEDMLRVFVKCCKKSGEREKLEAAIASAIAPKATRPRRINVTNKDF